VRHHCICGRTATCAAVSGRMRAHAGCDLSGRRPSVSADLLRNAMLQRSCDYPTEIVEK
jgi:hypothetical protein